MLHHILNNNQVYLLHYFVAQELKDENGRLFKLLSERDYEIRQLKKKREEDKMALAGK